MGLSASSTGFDLDLAAPYRRGWPDWLAEQMELLPGPSWCYYLGAWAVLFTFGALVAWRDFRDTPAFIEHLPYYALITGTLIYLLGLKHYLRLCAGASLDAFRPVYQEADDASGEVWPFAESKFRFTNTPAGRTLLASIAGMGVVSVLVALDTAPFERLGIPLSPVSFAFNVLMELCIWATVGAIVYSVVRSLRLVSHFYTRHARVSLFQMQPLYAFPALTARFALGAVIGPAIFFALLPGLLTGSVSLALAIGAAAGALIMFASPLAGAHTLLAGEKNALLSLNAQRLHGVLERLHAIADVDAGGDAVRTQNLLLGLQHERTILEGIRTWPWRPGLLPAFLSALLLPITIWLIQFGLARLLGS